MWAVRLLLACWACAAFGRRLRTVEPFQESTFEEKHDSQQASTTSDLAGGVGLPSQLKSFSQLLLASHPSAAWQATSVGPGVPMASAAAMSSRTSAPVLYGERGIKNSGPVGSPKNRRQNKKMGYKVNQKQGYRKGGPLQRSLVRVKGESQIRKEAEDKEAENEEARQAYYARERERERQHKIESKVRWEPESMALENAEEIEATYGRGGDLYDDRMHVELVEGATGRHMLCELLEETKVKDHMYASMMPVDTPVAIVQIQGEDIVEIDDEKLLDDIFPSAKYVCKQIGLTLRRTPVELTVEGLEEVDGTHRDGKDVDFYNDNDGLEMDELVDFKHRGQEFWVYRILEPVYLVGRHAEGDKFVMIPPKEMKEVAPFLEEEMTKRVTDPEPWEKDEWVKRYKDEDADDDMLDWFHEDEEEYFMEEDELDEEDDHKD